MPKKFGEPPITVNTKILLSPITGVQRYLIEILRHAEPRLTQISSKPIIGGIKGHLWEQFLLPLKAQGSLLWSPSNSGPLLSKRQVLTVHDVVHMDHPEWLTRNYVLWYRFLLPRLVLRVRRVIAISEFTKQRLLATTKITEDKITVIYNGVDQLFHPRQPDALALVLDALNLPSRRYVLTVSSLEPRKNLIRLLAAWRIAQPQLPSDIWLVIAGAKGRSSVFADDAATKDMPPQTHLTGHVPDDVLPSLYAGAMAFAYVSEYEGFGLPVLEAMASGVPVMVSNTSAFPEVVGDAGLYINPFSIDDIAAGLVRLLSNPGLAKELANLGLDRAKKFSWERTASLTLQVLREAAAET